MSCSSDDNVIETPVDPVPPKDTVSSSSSIGTSNNIYDNDLFVKKSNGEFETEFGIEYSESNSENNEEKIIVCDRMLSILRVFVKDESLILNGNFSGTLKFDGNTRNADVVSVFKIVF